MSEPASFSLTNTRNGRYMLFGALYFAQGAIASYVLVFNNLYLRAFGAAAWQLSLLNGLLVVPFILKIGIGLLSDKVKLSLPLFGSGHRRPYISLGLVLISVGGIAAAFVPPVEMYPLFVVTALFIALGLAIYDTVADGYAIDVTPPEEQGQIQGVMVVSRAMGLVLLASVYGRIIEQFGWTVIFVVVALLTLTPQILVRLTNEPTERSETQQFSWQALRSLWRPDILRFGLYAIIYSVAVYGANAIVTLFANEGLGQSLVQVGDVAALGGIGMVVGGAVGTYTIRRPNISIWQQGVWTAVGVFSILVLMALVANESNIMIMFVLWGIWLSASELIYITLAMAKADRRMGAGQYAIFMAISNIGVGMGQSASTSLVDTVDYRWIFVGLAVVSLLSFPLLMAMRQDDERDPNPLLTAVSGN
ncbi:MAG: MFS transporter [Ardenticatenaceae bacterium]|nr:MFS transporter [Anaerolineales bacterium]MCB8938345.1 MFS transporter [Ardenticatenaceae bacterium]MCB8975348.1 MFS transporter [Ardenticatenaceae bacterium]